MRFSASPTYAKDDDCGKGLNSLLRQKSEISAPLKTLTVGLYHIRFTTYKKGEVKGTFLAQIGSTVKIPGIEMVKTIDKLIKKINK